MKKQNIRLAVLLLACIFVLPTAVTAIEMRASDYIDWYEVDAVSTGGGDIAIKFSVEGTGRMDYLGAEEITVYEKINGIWMIADYFDRDDSGMVSANDNRFTNAIYFSGYTDMEYKIGVTVFAEDSTGSDSRYQEVYVNT